MAVVIQDNFSLAAAKAVDNRYEKVTSGGVSVPYANLSEAYTAIPLVYRHIGLTVAIDNGSGGADEYWFKDNTTTLVPKLSGIGQTLTANTTININGNTFCIRDAGAACTPDASPTGFCITPGCDAKTSDLNWNLNTNTFDGKNVFNTFSWFKDNVGIGIVPEPHSSVIVTSDTKLKVYKSPGTSTNRLTNNPIAVTSNSILDMAGTMGTGNTSIYCGNFNQLSWTPSANFDFTTSGGSNLSLSTFSGVGGYLQIVSAKTTTNSNMSASTHQVYTAAESFQFFTNVSSASSAGVTTITLSGTDTTSLIQVGDQVLIKGGTGNFGIGVVNVYVKNIPSPTTFTIGKIQGTYPSYTTINFTPSIQLSGANIVVARANSGNTLGSIDKVIGARVLGIAPDRYAGSSVKIGNAVGLQIDDQRTIPSPYNQNGWIGTSVTSGYLENSYGIRQVGELDKNYFAGPFIIPRVIDTSGVCDAGNKSMGVARLSGGTVRVNTTASKLNKCMVFVSLMAPGSSPGVPYGRDLYIYDGYFLIYSTSPTDDSFVNWWIIANEEY